MEINGSSGAAALGTGAAQGAEDTDLDRDAFMRLLVAQIRNQDPMDPMDTREMMTQLTQLTSVEHLIGIEEQISAVQIGTASLANAQVASFVGRTVEADTSNLRLTGTDPASGGYTLSGRAQEVTATIRDADGRVVRTMQLDGLTSGAHAFTWDGRNDEGVRVPEGRYHVDLSATDANGAPIAVDPRVSGRVNSVSYEDGYPELVLDGGFRVMMGDVRRVSGETSTSAVTGSSTPAGTSSVTNPRTVTGAYSATAQDAATQLVETNQ
ncbi:MAG: flagellar hook assembly protein FlgD [Sandaracinaceae bacterium]